MLSQVLDYSTLSCCTMGAKYSTTGFARTIQDKRLIILYFAFGFFSAFLRFDLAEYAKEMYKSEYSTIIFPLATYNRDLKQATFLSHGRKPEVNISHARTMVYPSSLPVAAGG